MPRRKIAPDSIQAVTRHSAHTNAWQPTLRQVESIGRDVTLEMQRGYESLNATTPSPSEP